MNKKAFAILRWGLAITFIWIGVLVYRNPLGWAAFIQPWALPYLPASLETMMVQTAYLDIATGLLMLFSSTAWLGGLIGAGHLVVVLVVSGITDVTVRDIGLLCACAGLFLESMPVYIRSWIKI